MTTDDNTPSSSPSSSSSIPLLPVDADDTGFESEVDAVPAVPDGTGAAGNNDNEATQRFPVIAAGQAAERRDPRGEELGFQTDFPGGNGIVSFRLTFNPGPTIVELTVEAKQSSAPLWFHTKLNGLAGESVHLRLTNALQLAGDYRGWAGNTIVIRDGAEPFHRSPLPIIEDDAAGVQRIAYPLWIRHPNFEVAACYPYQHEEVLNTIRDCRTWQAARIGRSREGRVIERYRLGGRTASASCPEDKRPGVYLICGQTAGATSAQWVLDGLLRSAALDQDARLAVQNLDLWVLPALDVDGQANGCYGRGLPTTEFDVGWLNPPLHTEIRAVQIDLERWALTTKPVLLINLQGTAFDDRSTYLIRHGHSTESVPRGVDKLATIFQQRLGKLTRLQTARPENAAHGVGALSRQFETNPGSWPNAAASFFSSAVPAYSLAVSLQGSSAEDFEIADYHRLGHALLLALAEAFSTGTS